MKVIGLLAAGLLPATVWGSGFSIIGTSPGPWPDILQSIGHHQSPAVEAKIFVGRAGAPASSNWTAKLAQGCFLIVEGESPLAASFGFRPGKENVRVSSLEDVHRPGLPIVFEHPVDLRRFELPEGARVFAKESWSGAPLIAGLKRGSGAILWVAANPGKSGYERFPYILHALSDLGMSAPFQSGRLWAFFDYSYRTRVDLDYFAERWRAAGIGSIHVASWHFYEPDAARDDYLKHLIEACHKQAITVYAWVELPHVSERFWNDHPEWREKTAVLQDAQLDWRKLMNLQNPDCVRAVSAGLRSMLDRFDWDGVNLAELYFESLEGESNPARFTPMNNDVRAEFQAGEGWDPVEIYTSHKDGESIRKFLDYRADLARRMQETWMSEIANARAAHPDLDIVLTHVDDRFDTGMKDAIGADAARVLPLLKKRDFTFLIEDPATVWNLGPQRYREIAKQYQPIAPKPERLAIDINVVDRYQDVYPTKQQTGTELFELVHMAAASFPRVALYFENSILRPDLALLPSAAAAVNRVETIGGKTMVDAPYGVGVPWRGPSLVDGKVWPIANDRVVWLPAGTHSLESGDKSSGARVLDFNGTIAGARGLSNHGIEISYESQSRAVAVLDREPNALEIDGRPGQLTALKSTSGDQTRYSVLLPRGQHVAVFVAN